VRKFFCDTCKKEIKKHHEMYYLVRGPILLGEHCKACFEYVQTVRALKKLRAENADCMTYLKNL